MLREELAGQLSWHVVGVGESGVAGYLIGRTYSGEWHLLDLAVAEGERRKGLGGMLLDGFLDAADRAGVPVVLEVRPGNRAAVSLYTGRGFETVGMRPHYYTDTKEDALAMERSPGTRSHRRQAGRAHPGYRDVV